jgi:fermentation-respiration switch protein FrsA (DUF1100 family)
VIIVKMDNSLVMINKKPGAINRKILIVIISVIILILINSALLAAGNYFYNTIMTYNISNKYSEEQYQKEITAMRFNVDRFNSLQKDSITLNSKFGYQLKGTFIRNAVQTQNTVIMVHGIGKDKKWSSMKYGDIFLDQGYNIFVYDSRNHGESGGDHPSYGYYEKEDLQTCVSYIKSQNPEGIIGIHSESLGAATALLHAENYNKNNEVAFYIEDCGYSDLYELYNARTVDYNIPKPLCPVILNYLSFICKVRAGFFLSDVSPIKNIEIVTIPIMFIHGDSDNFVPVKMANDLYSKKTGIKALYYAKGAEHAKSINVDKAKYQEEVVNFLKSAVKI